jgi:CRISPR-associated protein Cas6
MYWNDDAGKPTYRVPDDIVDLLFRIDCPRLPADHAYALSRAVSNVLPWFADDERAGIHLIHGAATGNGWQRPADDPADNRASILHLSKRTRFILRIPSSRVAAAERLSGHTLDIDGYPITIGSAHTRLLSTQTTLFARHVVTQADTPESDFIEQTVEQLQSMGIIIKKLLCGRLHSLQTPDGELFMRSLMLAELEREHAVLLQQQGLGPGRKMGCGLFIPHKGIAPVHTETQHRD